MEGDIGSKRESDIRGEGERGGGREEGGVGQEEGGGADV